MSVNDTTPVPSLAPDAATVEHFRVEVLHGLRRAHKALPCKYFYDEAGSRLFEQICELPEYYLTRTELAILRRHAAEMAAVLGPDCLLIEYGSGSSAKTRLLLDHLAEPAGYVPIDISAEPLRQAAAALTRDYPKLDVRPVCGDFAGSFSLPADNGRPARRVVYFPGSTIGNFVPAAAASLLQRTARLCGPGGGLFLGADRKKDPRILHAAYNDSQGVTAAFNLNLLQRINRELGANFQPDQFWHHALYDPGAGRIEMHLVSRRDQVVRLTREDFAVAEGESICTEYSYKYSLRDLQELAEAAGFEVRRTWSDERDYFAVLYLTVS